MSRDSVYQYIYQLKDARLLNVLSAEGKGVSTLQKPDKIYLENANLAYALTEKPDMGNIRETFLLGQLLNAAMEVHAPREGDFIAKNITDAGYSKIIKEQHIKFVVKQDNIVFTGIGFNMADKFYLLQMKKPLDIVFTIGENEWNGQKNLQLKVMDIRLNESAPV